MERFKSYIMKILEYTLVILTIIVSIYALYYAICSAFDGNENYTIYGMIIGITLPHILFEFYK